MTVYVVVPVHNRVSLTLKFIESLESQNLEEFLEVLVVDDGSSDGTASTIARRQNRFPTSVLAGSGSLWWAGSIRLALVELSSILTDEDWVYLGNNDTLLMPDHLSNLLETARNCFPSIVGSRSLERWPDGSLHSTSGGFNISLRNLTVVANENHSLRIVRVDALTGRGLLFPASAIPFARVRPRVTPQHFADLLLTHAMKEKGFELIVDNHAVSLQLATASSAVLPEGSHRLSLKKGSPLYAPALFMFWVTLFLRHVRRRFITGT